MLKLYLNKMTGSIFYPQIMCILLILMFSLIYPAFGENISSQVSIKEDSLLNMAAKLKGREKMDVLGDLGEYYMFLHPEKAFQTGKNIVEYSEDIDYQYGKARGLIIMGISDMNLGKFEESLQFMQDASKIMKDIKQNHKIPLIYRNIGIVLYRMGRYDEAFSYYLNSARLYEEQKDSIGYARSISGLAIIYRDRKEYEKALGYLNKAKNIFRKGNCWQDFNSALNNMGTVLNTIGRYDEALSVYNEALENNRKIKSSDEYFMNLYNNIAGVFSNKGDKKMALDQFHQALKLSKKISDKYAIGTILYNIGEIYSEEGKFDLAISYFDSCYTIAKEIMSPQMKTNCFKGFSELYKKKKDYRNAFYYLEKYTVENDSLFAEKSSRRIEELQIRYESEKNKRKLAEKDLEIRKKKSQNLVLVISLSSVFFILLFLVYLYFYTRKKKVILEIINHKLSESEASLKTSNDTKEKLFGIVTHDLKNPFGTMMSLTSFLEDSYQEIDEKQKVSAIQTIRKSVLNAYELLETLTKWSIAQSRKIQTDKKALDFSLLANSILSELRIEAKKKNIRAISEIPPGTIAFADETMIKTVMRNLIGNALKFTPENGNISISSKIIDGLVEIAICDNGIGIPETDKSKIFRVDVKHTTPGTAKESGTGLGLILDRELVEKNGGNIWFESEFKKGTTFYFTLSQNA